jgi:hypothetical protein
MKYTITKDQLVKVLQYLSGKPWQEVHPLIQELSNLPLYKEAKPTEAPSEETKPTEK